MILTAVCTWAQMNVISGKVVDKETNKPLTGASVTMDGLSVVTNDDGFFTMKSEGPATSLAVSHLGYHSQHVSLNGQYNEQLTISLTPAAIALNEVLVTANDPMELVMEAIRHITDNYSRKPELYHCFYREKVMKRQNYIGVAEGVTDMYKTDYRHGTNFDRAAIRKGRRLLSPKQTDTLSVKVMGGPATALLLDLVKNTDFLLNADELSLYSMKMEMPATIADRPQFVVSIEPHAMASYALYYGKLYIDQETKAFTRIELDLDMSNREKATSMMLIKKPRGLRFKPKEMSCIVDYRMGNEGVMRMTYLRTTFRFNCDWKRRLFATSFTAQCEMAVTSVTNQEVKPIRGRDSFDQRDAFFDKVDFFRDPMFWQDYNIIEPTESLDKAINRLLKRYPSAQ